MTATKLKATRAGQIADYFFDLVVQRKRGDYYAGVDGEPVECPGVAHGGEAPELGLTAVSANTAMSSSLSDRACMRGGA